MAQIVYNDKWEVVSVSIYKLVGQQGRARL